MSHACIPLRPSGAVLASVMFLAATVAPCGAGTLRAAGGSLTVSGTVTASNVVVESGATLRGSGTVIGDMLVGGTVSPGLAPVSTIGTQTVYGAVNFSPGSVLESHAASHTSLDRINATGTVTGTCSVVLTTGAAVVPVKQIVMSGGAASDFSGFMPAAPGRWRLGEVGAVDLIVTDRIGDSDTDALPDWWELEHFSSRTNASPTAHDDADVHNNLSEYIADTDPNDGASILRITNMVVGGTTVLLFWQGGREATQYLETTVGLPSSGIVWQAVFTSAPPTADSQGYPHNSVTNKSRFYRVRADR